ncbi:hypothetical protein [Capnocytophaga sputigena]|jgi:hypothetical protein|uniref:hypothetical protein n=1 Tax=Capnocytophaga sputigena TaxID=1019 RepID=UPI0028D4A342|nr:hypothetical protein [Capnocytophaga sputigena]
MTSSIITNRVNVKISNGQKAQTEYITLEKGKCIGVYFIPFKNYNPEFAIEMSVRDPQSNTIIEPVDYRDFQHKGGGHIQGMKQVGFECNNNKFQVAVLAEQNLTDDFIGELVFTIQRDCNCSE